MYKVFIENKPIIFQINSQNKPTTDLRELWEKVTLFLASDQTELNLDIHSVADFEAFFSEYKYIEAAGGLVQKGDAFLFIQRNGVWDIPKGKLEKGEMPEIAAVREIEEECGLIAPVIKEHLINTYHTYPHKGKNVLKKTFWYWLNEGGETKKLVPQEEEGITAVEYLKVDEFECVMQNTFMSIIDVIAALKKKI